MNIKKSHINIINITFFLFALFVCVDLSNIGNLNLFNFSFNLNISVFFSFIFIFTTLIIYRKYLLNLFNSIPEYKNIIYLLIVLLVIAYISSFFSELCSFAVTTTFFRYTIFFICFLFSLFLFKSNVYFKEIFLKSFIAINVIIILSSIFDFYIPSFNGFLIQYFGHPELKHSFMEFNGVKHIRPSGFVSDSNLTAFTIIVFTMLLLVNIKENHKKYFYVLIFLIAGYSFGMLASRSALIFSIVGFIYIIIKEVPNRKFGIVLILCFWIIQLTTPQTLVRIQQFFKPDKTLEETQIGRPVIWSAAIKAFKTSPVIGIGSSVFFKKSVGILEQMKTEGDERLKNEYFNELNPVNPHNIFLTALSEYGIIGLIFFMIFLFYLFKFHILKKYFLSILFLSGTLFVSTLSNYAPYYKYYLLLCIFIIIFSSDNMKINYSKFYQGSIY